LICSLLILDYGNWKTPAWESMTFNIHSILNESGTTKKGLMTCGTGVSGVLSKLIMTLGKRISKFDENPQDDEPLLKRLHSPLRSRIVITENPQLLPTEHKKCTAVTSLDFTSTIPRVNTAKKYICSASQPTPRRKFSKLNL
jgi:hypothetical protein